MNKDYTPEELERMGDELLQEEEPELVDHTDGETIACKTGKANKVLLERLCNNRLHCTKNEALQMVIDCLIRYMDDRHNLSEELNMMMSLFEGFTNWGNHINLAEPVERNTIIAAIYVMARGNKTGKRLAMVEGAYDELTRTETYNTQMMLDIFLEAYDEQLYRNLRLLSAGMGCDSISYALHKMVSVLGTDDMQQTIRQMFEDNRRADNGHDDLPAGGPYKRTQGGSFDGFERKEYRQASIAFPADEEEEFIHNTF